MPLLIQNALKYIGLLMLLRLQHRRSIVSLVPLKFALPDYKQLVDGSR